MADIVCRCYLQMQEQQLPLLLAARCACCWHRCRCKWHVENSKFLNLDTATTKRYTRTYIHIHIYTYIYVSTQTQTHTNKCRPSKHNVRTADVERCSIAYDSSLETSCNYFAHKGVHTNTLKLRTLNYALAFSLYASHVDNLIEAPYGMQHSIRLKANTCPHSTVNARNCLH